FVVLLRADSERNRQEAAPARLLQHGQASGSQERPTQVAQRPETSNLVVLRLQFFHFSGVTHCSSSSSIAERSARVSGSSLAKKQGGGALTELTEPPSPPLLSVLTVPYPPAFSWSRGLML